MKPVFSYMIPHRGTRMRSLLLCLVVAVSCYSLVRAQNAERPKTPLVSEADIREATTQLTNLAAEAGHAYARRDLASLERLTADDYVQTDVRGGVLPRSQWLDFVRNRKSEMTVDTDNLQISFYGATAVVAAIGRTPAKTPKERTSSNTSQWTLVWTLTPAGWKRHAFQNTYVNANADHCPPPAAP
jgi:ketosteroid isomerase-like protein